MFLVVHVQFYLFCRAIERCRLSLSPRSRAYIKHEFEHETITFVVFRYKAQLLMMYRIELNEKRLNSLPFHREMNVINSFILSSKE